MIQDPENKQFIMVRFPSQTGEIAVAFHEGAAPQVGERVQFRLGTGQLLSGTVKTRWWEIDDSLHATLHVEINENG